MSRTDLKNFWFRYNHKCVNVFHWFSAFMRFIVPLNSRLKLSYNKRQCCSHMRPRHKYFVNEYHNMYMYNTTDAFQIWFNIIEVIHIYWKYLTRRYFHQLICNKKQNFIKKYPNNMAKSLPRKLFTKNHIDNYPTKPKQTNLQLIRYWIFHTFTFCHRRDQG